jgi:hypothetical protein
MRLVPSRHIALALGGFSKLFMASTRTQQGALLSNATFIQQVTGSLAAYAWTVIFEAAGTTNHANRLKFAQAILSGPSSAIQQATNMVASLAQSAAISAQAGTPTAILDSDVDTAVTNQFNAFANSYVTQLNSGAIVGIGS